MTKQEAAIKLTMHLASCGMLMPEEWLAKNGPDSELQQAFQMAIDALNDNSGWISVEERLPDLIPCNAGTAYSEAIIVWTSGRKAMVAVWDGIDFLCAADYWEAWGEDITHWMPLPEPPTDTKREIPT